MFAVVIAVSPTGMPANFPESIEVDARAQDFGAAASVWGVLRGIVPIGFGSALDHEHDGVAVETGGGDHVYFHNPETAGFNHFVDVGDVFD